VNICSCVISFRRKLKQLAGDIGKHTIANSNSDFLFTKQFVLGVIFLIILLSYIMHRSTGMILIIFCT